MTIISPTTKGFELYKQYYNILLFSQNDCIPPEISNILAKKFARIAAKQTLDALAKDYDAFNKDSYEFWKTVIDTIDSI